MGSSSQLADEAAALKSPPESHSNGRGPALQALRRATLESHRALDHHRLMQQLVSAGLTRELYAESLAAMFRPHARLERQVHESRHLLESGLELCKRLGSLAADLLELEWPVFPVPRLPAERSEGRAVWWGRVYVLEGSRLGSIVIAKRVRSRLGNAVPCRFFGEAGMPDGHRAMSAMCERALEDPGELEQAMASARAAFAAYKADLDAFEHGSARTK